ncbi:arsenic resistance protein [Paenibacillus wulumuqiensis]|uniref:arsenic resistance protein n=1 Tax=Paenibacillus wulumuqiensis TaxID=1567107 RepID=UPI0006197D75|nr:arsenic resistance protein [Paenibacillus wulumuqiensis]
MITREALEHRQIGIYLLLLVLGVAIGTWMPSGGTALDILRSPLLAILLYSMFVQIPFIHIRKSMGNAIFTTALLLTNFVLVPLVVWLLIMLFPQPTPALIGVCLVLLTPCIDYVIVFTGLGRGNEQLMLAATPLLLIVQLILLPFYLRLFIGPPAAEWMQAEPFIVTFIVLIAIPLLLAVATQLWAQRQSAGRRWQSLTAWLPVPLMGLVLLVITASQIHRVYEDARTVVGVLPVYAGFALLMPVAASLVARLCRLDTGAGRTLIFSASTRNSLVVLPLALALPAPWAVTAAAVIVAQTMVELIAELIYIRIVPALLLRSTTLERNRRSAGN